MYTTAPEIINDTTVGQVIVPATPTVTPTSTSASQSATSTPTPRLGQQPSPEPTPVETEQPKQFMIKPFSVYGYGPPNTPIYLVGFGVSERTVSDNNGLFRFTKIYSYSLFYPELCIYAVDDQNRITKPVCIPGLPKNRIIPTEVGPVFLPPTFSITKNNIKTNDQSTALGLAIPNTVINVYISKTGEYSLPLYQIKSRSDGTFEFSLPTSSLAKYKIAISEKVGQHTSEKSNNITFSVVGYITTFFQSLKSAFLNNKLSLLVILELIVIMFLGVLVLKSPTRGRKGKKRIIDLHQKYINLLNQKLNTKKEL